MKKLLAGLSCFLIILGLTACDSADKPSEAKLKIACNEVSCAIIEPGLSWIKQHGLNVELVMMDNNVNIIKSVNDGSVDAGVGVHSKFMESFNQQNNGKLVMVKPYPFTTGIGFYSERYKSLDTLPEQAKIAIMNDAMNMDRGLRMLQSAGLIELDKTKNDSYSLLDITKNPKQLEFIDMDQTQTVRSLQDVDGAVVFFTHMRNANKDFRSYIVRDKSANEFPMGLVVRQDNTEQPWANTLAEALRSESVRQGITKNFDGVFEYLD
ncbi:MetQ/NlpA family ABC transporter substrate-binding protein [Budvicia aquatica]|uniref:MetQ/NlpA family ABC transporter substrate-binding protein n=1 Tax=Budvicia aquatica TaxID=82979 RepID=UPI002088ABA4|nr:MetQ/NlpA family ABC transporter substrate-binding protein [Budvicia aquatica]GKX53127.1 lipoprotein [Budvicia aquatica]